MTANALPATLWVYMGADRVGRLYPTDPLSFEYLPEWIGRQDARPLCGQEQAKEGGLAVTPCRLLPFIFWTG